MTTLPATQAPGPTLGIWDGHDAGAALYGQGRVIAAVSEERLTRVKQQGGFPARAVAEVLALGGVAAADVDTVAVAGTRGRLPARLLDRWYAATPPQSVDPLSLASEAFAAFQHGMARLSLVGAWEQAGSEAVLRRRLGQQGLGRARLVLVDHHLAHAATAAARLGRGQSLIVTMDGYGDGVSAAVWRNDGGRLQRLGWTGPAGSLALLYGALTRLLGFKEGEEGKLTGLAALGNDPRSAPDLEPWIRHHAGWPHLDRKAALRALRRALAAGVAPADLAQALQAAMEAAVLGSVQHWLQATGLDRLGVAGGLFANVSLNGRLAALGLRQFAVFPAMGDQGLCVGAALAAAGWDPHDSTKQTVAEPMPDVLLGPDLSGTPDPQAVADLLARGEAVGIARGRLEFGPRALGHRSILLHPGDPRQAARLGQRLGREPFMPFAPILQAESWDAAFARPRAGIEAASREMVLALPVQPGFAQAAAASVHVDGTARPQVVEPARDPWLHAVLQAFTARTGCPALVNTSFNRHREPIVNRAEEALEAGRQVGLGAVVLGPDLVRLP